MDKGGVSTSIPVLAAHFFQHDVRAVRSLTSCLTGISELLARHFPSAFKSISVPGIVEKFDSDPERLFNEILVQPMLRVSEKERIGILGQAKRAVVVIDALDECQASRRRALVRIVQKDWGNLPPWLGLIGESSIFSC